MNRLTQLSLLIFVFMLFACSSNDEPVYTQITPSTLTAGDPIPQADDPILTVTGRIDSADAVMLDVAALEAMGIVEYTVFDPFDKRDITYRGVLMSDLLDTLQIEEGATTLEMVALNDYRIDLDVTEMYNYPVILALMADGEYMQPDYHGPTMIVYPYDDYDFDESVYDSRWIWQLASINVR